MALFAQGGSAEETSTTNSGLGERDYNSAPYADNVRGRRKGRFQLL